MCVSSFVCVTVLSVRCRVALTVVFLSDTVALIERFPPFPSAAPVAVQRRAAVMQLVDGSFAMAVGVYRARGTDVWQIRCRTQLSGVQSERRLDVVELEGSRADVQQVIFGFMGGRSHDGGAGLRVMAVHGAEALTRVEVQYMEGNEAIGERVQQRLSAAVAEWRLEPAEAWPAEALVDRAFKIEALKSPSAQRLQ